jgi:peptide/nickel transport system permease protein
MVVAADSKKEPVALVRERTTWDRARMTLRNNRLGLVGLIILLVEVALAISAPLVMPHDPIVQDTAQRLKPPFFIEGGTTVYLLGTDQLGRDILTRIVFGARMSLLIAFSSVAISVPLGVCLGIVAGWGGRIVDDVIMRIADIQLAFPFVLLAIAVVAALGTGTENIILVLGIFGWVVYARVTRADVLSLREKEFIEAARAIGVSSARIIRLHLLPNVLTSITVIATFAVAQMILIESSLSFLGLGVQPPTPSWGGMLSDGRNYIPIAPWLSTFPGLAIMITVMAVNFIGDWLRDFLDPTVQNI